MATKLLLAASVGVQAIKVQSNDVLAQTMGQQEFNSLFIRGDGLNHMLLSDSERVMEQLQG